jgi:N-acetylglucosaminyldiphosphoundecaprenol N-acetyl-beta-D-mannosaminyltransferase
MAEHCGRLEAKVLVGVGAAFDFLAGQLRVPPRAIQRSGFEWAFRLAMEPRRLWRRYLKNNPLFVASIVAQQLNLLRSEIGSSKDADRVVTIRPHHHG